MHSGTIVTDYGFRHESRCFSIRVSNVVHYIFECLGPIRALHQAAVFGAYLTLSGSRHFVVMDLNFNTHFLQRKTHGGPDVMQGIDRRNGEIAAFNAGTVPGISALVFLRGAPGCFLGLDFYRTAGHVRMPCYGVKNEEFGLWTEICSVANAGRLQVSL